MKSYELTDSQKSKAGLIPRNDRREKKKNTLDFKRKRIRAKYIPKDEYDSFQDHTS